MQSKQIAVELAEFLDSEHARALAAVPRDATRKIAEAFIAACYDEVGKAPRLIDAEDLRAVVVERLPARFAKKDAAIEHAPAVLEALIEHVAATAVMSTAFEVRNALEAACAELVAIVSSGRNALEAPARSDPFVHRASKLGRNDPCSCGSGKKFKKCHGKDA